MNKLIFAPLLAALALTACDRKPNDRSASASPAAPIAAPQPPKTDYPQVEAPAPGTPGGLPDDRTPLSEAPFTPQSAQGAADVVQTYFAHIGQKDYAAAHKLLRNWAIGPVEFTQSFAKYYQYNANVGSPGPIEGAAGSLYVEVPVLIYGRLKSGEVVNELGTATLHRVNGVPGATPEQQLWKIEKLETKPTEAGGVANG